MAECRCMCSPCGHDDHCGGDVCPHLRDLDGLCGWCERLKGTCLEDPCTDAAEILFEAYGELPSGPQDEQTPLPGCGGLAQAGTGPHSADLNPLPTDKNGDNR